MSVQDLIASDKRDFLFFWGHQEKQGKVTKACFSQWYACDFDVNGQHYTTAEQYMMAEKARLMGDKDTCCKILEASGPSEFKALGRMVKNFDETLWNAHKYDIVVKGNLYKFSQNQDLKTFLLSTENRILVEASPYDHIWGIGLAADAAEANDPNKWRGENLLGFALMEVRSQLLSNEQAYAIQR